MLNDEMRRARTGDSGSKGGGRTRRRWAMLLGVLVGLLLGVGAAGAPMASASTGPGASNVDEWACDHVTVHLFGFENLSGYTATIKVTIDGKLYSYTHYPFSGPEAFIVVPIHVPPGHHALDVFTKWKGNTSKGGRDQPLKGGIDCDPEPGFSIVKKQRRGGSGAYSTATIPNGKVGEVVEYGIVVKNTGNVPLKMSNFSDPNCDEGTITGGPGEAAIPINGFSNYFCKHTLTEADHVAGSRCNVASVTGNPPEGEGEPVTKESNEACTELPTPKDSREFSCKGITFFFEGFPNLPNNTVKMHIRVDGVYTPGPTSKEFVFFTFNGPTASYTFPLNLSPGKHGLDGYAKWNTNGFKGGSDIFKNVTCTAEPNFTIEKFQKIDGSEDPFTSSTLPGKEGETIDYQVVVKNIGNVPLKFSNFIDEKCDEGTLTGGPGEAEVASEATTTYECSHLITNADSEAGSVENIATDTGTPKEGEPITHSSNTVIVEVS